MINLKKSIQRSLCAALLTLSLFLHHSPTLTATTARRRMQRVDSKCCARGSAPSSNVQWQHKEKQEKEEEKVMVQTGLQSHLEETSRLTKLCNRCYKHLRGL